MAYCVTWQKTINWHIYLVASVSHVFVLLVIGSLLLICKAFWYALHFVFEKCRGLGIFPFWFFLPCVLKILSSVGCHLLHTQNYDQYLCFMLLVQFGGGMVEWKSTYVKKLQVEIAFYKNDLFFLLLQQVQLKIHSNFLLMYCHYLKFLNTFFTHHLCTHIYLSSHSNST